MTGCDGCCLIRGDGVLLLAEVALFQSYPPKYLTRSNVTMDHFPAAEDDFLPFSRLQHYHNLVLEPILHHYEPHDTDYELLHTINLTIEIRKLLTGALSVLGNTSEE